MAKEVTFTVDAPMNGDLAQRMWQFLIDATAKREQVTVTGTVRRRLPEAGDEAS